MSDTFELNGRQIVLKASSDRVVAERVLRHIQRRMHEDDWRPYTSKADAVQAWFVSAGFELKCLRL